MNIEEFIEALTNDSPPSVSDELTALWYEAKGNWDKAHKIVQDISSSHAAWVHAYLHRKEGDQWNAEYWYNRAGKPVCKTSFEQEWKDITEELLK